MIRCNSCGRLWPQSTIWCGHCRKTLGKRICPEGHESPVNAQCCSICGSNKLTPATTSRNLRPVSWLIAVGLAVLLLPCVLGVAGSALQVLWCWFINTLLPPILSLAMLSFLVSLFVGDRGRRAIGDFWTTLLRWCGALIVGLTRAILALIERLLR